MRCLSTRGGDERSLSEAIAAGLAADGGLFMPAMPLPRIVGRPREATLAATAEWLLAPYFEGEVLESKLGAICEAAFTFEAPIRWLPSPADRLDGLLELFHGPTAAFKDFGARFLAETLTASRAAVGGEGKTVLVATSGDTGAAVAAAFHRRPGFRVIILYPDGRVSARQAHQLGSFGDNVRTFRVAGTFDDCQRLAKEAFADDVLRDTLHLTSANSISLGRLLPQMAYYAHAALRLSDEGRTPVSFVVPTGNLGNAFACLMARAMGLPIDRVALATNANRVLPDFLRNGRYTPTASITTLANAMDVGAPSNLERLRVMFERANEHMDADWVDDETIRATIRRTWSEAGVALCPHTACGVEVLRRVRAQGGRGTWLVAATAHPAKFERIVEPLIGQPVEVPPALAELLARPSRAEPLEPTLDALRLALA
ncbi:MAG: threonine synthase [Myxococcota bacterium]